MNDQARYIVRAPNGDLIADCDIKGAQLFAAPAELAAIASLAVGESCPLADEVGEFKLERVA